MFVYYEPLIANTLRNRYYSQLIVSSSTPGMEMQQDSLPLVV